MAIQIYNRTNIGVQSMLNDLETLWDWKKVVKDGTNVSQLWASDKVYLNKSDDYVYLNHTSGLKETACGYFFPYTSCRIVIVDNAMLVTNNDPSAKYIIVGKTLDLEGNESCGIIATDSEAVHRHFIFTDNMGPTSNYMLSNNFVSNSEVQTQLVPVCNNCGYERFINVFFTFMKPSDSEIGKATMNDKNYYISREFSVEYTA